MSEDSSAKIPVFDGTQKGFMMWWVRFHAFAVMRGFARALKDDPSMPENDTVIPADEEAKLAKKANEVAMASLTMAFKTDAMLNVIFKTMTTAWPGGLACKVVDELKRQFQPEDIMSRVELRRSLNKIQMKKGTDPAKLFEQIYLIQNRSKIEIQEIEFVAVILEAASEEYHAVLSSEQARLKDDLKVSDLENVMRNHWRTISSKSGSNDNDEEGKEVALAAVGKGFSGTCFLCKKKGHRIADCPQKKNKNSNNNDNKNKFQGKCNNCGKQGHKATDCWEKEENASKRPKNWKNREVAAAAVTIDRNSPVEYIMISQGEIKGEINPPDGFPATSKLLDHPDIWVADSATTMHNTCHSVGVTNLRKEGQAIVMGNGDEIKTRDMGEIHAIVCDRKGNQMFDVKLNDVAVNPSGTFNLFSTSKLQKEGWTLHGNDKEISLKKNNVEIKFDIIIPTPMGALYCAYLKRKVEMANIARAQTIFTINQAHERLGHMNEDRTRLTAETLGWKIKPGCFVVCKACAEAKAKQTNVPKVTQHVKASKDNPRIFLDISTVKDRTGKIDLTKPNWRIMVDERTGMKFSDFFTKKIDMVEATCKQLNMWNQAGLGVKYIRLDNAGENKKLEERALSAAWKLNINFEYTARDTPQQNSLAELGFTVLSAYGRALMSAAYIPADIRNKGVWREAIKTATDLDALVAIKLDGVLKPRVEHWSGKLPAYAHYLKTWGEAGTVKIKNKSTTNIEDRGVTCMFVGYTKQHAGDCYRMLNLNTFGIHESRDIIWLHRMYFAPSQPALEHAIAPAVVFQTPQAGESGVHAHVEPEPDQNNQNVVDLDAIDVDSIFELDDNNNFNNPDVSDDAQTEIKTTRSGRTVKPVNQLDINLNNKTYNKIIDEAGNRDGTEVKD